MTMTTCRTLAAAFAALALALTAVLLAPPADAAKKPKIGPVCTVKQAAKHPGKCIVIKVPKSTKPDVIVQVTPTPDLLPKT
jgi:hypothetical protein